MRSLFVVVSVVGGCWLLSSGCGPSHRDNNGVDTGPPIDGECQDLRCRVVDCAKQGRPDTTISGTVFAPNGTLALYGVTVYVPNHDPGFFTDGVKCTRCENMLPGDPIAQALSNEQGKFTLPSVPSGDNIPLVITVGKWRRQVKIPHVEQCQDNLIGPELTSLPRRKSEGEMPKIAIATGGCDALECLVRKIGVHDSEFTSDQGDGRVHLYTANGVDRNNVGETFAPSTDLTASVAKLKQYDLTMFSCECSEVAAAKSQAAMNNMKEYADAGGRAFFSHYNRVWITGETGNPGHAPPEWPRVATCTTDLVPSGSVAIDQVNNPRGVAFANWMINNGGASAGGVFNVLEPRQSCSAVDNMRAERWVYTRPEDAPMNFQFTTPQEVVKEERCGKVVFSDMHVASGSSSTPGTMFPSGCSSSTMSPQEKALAFMFFDIAACVGPIF